MKTTSIIILAISFGLGNATGGQTNGPTKDPDPLVAKHDLNRNGKIDVNERNPYVREMSRQRREEAKVFAAQQPVLSPQENLFYDPPQLTSELIKKYDSNQDGRLDNTERLNISQHIADAAKAEFRRFDTNQEASWIRKT